jgi:hypothetical protein
MRIFCCRTTVAALIATAATLSIPARAAGQVEAAGPVLTTPYFRFHSDFLSNLNDALVVAGRARRAQQSERFAAGQEKACFDALPNAERAGWNRAVDYYAEIVSPGQYADRPQMLLRLLLAGVVRKDGLTDAAERRFLDVSAGFHEAATPAYRQCRWPEQDTVNRRWIDRLGTLLAAHETALGQRLPQIFGRAWAGLPFRVDVVETVDSAGANALNLNPPGVHILASSTAPTNQDRAALETVFHEASHFLTGRDAPLPAALAAAARDAGGAVRGDLTHQVHFFMTGEAVRRVFERPGEPPYTPFLFSLKLFSDQFREAVARVWPAYMDGKRTLAEAAVELIGAMSSATPR